MRRGGGSDGVDVMSKPLAHCTAGKACRSLFCSLRTKAGHRTKRNDLFFSFLFSKFCEVVSGEEEALSASKTPIGKRNSTVKEGEGRARENGAGRGSGAGSGRDWDR